MGDELVIDGGMACFDVIEKIGNDLRCRCSDPGLFLPRARISFWRDGKLVERNHELPTLSAKVSTLYPIHCLSYVSCSMTLSSGIWGHSTLLNVS